MPKLKTGHRTNANFPEELVGMALESFLAFLTFPFCTYSIEPFSRSRERWLAADARLIGNIAGFAPLYMQFKRPTAYAAVSTSRIVSDRRKLKLSVDPSTLFFDLRDKQPAHHDYQHNVLHKLSSRLRRRGLGDAVYVCPLFLDRAAYRLNIYISAMGRRFRFWDDYPFQVADLLVDSSPGRVSLDRVPLLAEHVCIRPHDKVANAKHSYSFTESGKAVCFHSPTALPEEGKPLSRWLSGLWNGVAERRTEGLINGQTALESLQDLVSQTDEDDAIVVPVEVLQTKDGFEAWNRFGAFLQQEHAIDQYALVAWRRQP